MQVGTVNLGTCEDEHNKTGVNEQELEYSMICVKKK